jgi:SAM-dependent methyltransferase
MIHAEHQASDSGFERVSFRDPSGSLTRVSGRLIRVVTEAGGEDLQAFLNSSVAGPLIGSQTLVGTRILDPAQREELMASAPLRDFSDSLGAAHLCEHEEIDFPTYPYEWSPAMLYEAASLTLGLCDQLLPAGFGLKDATPLNVLFRGPRPVFVDLLSIERREPGDAAWMPEAQFIRTFLLPLAASLHFGLSPSQTLSCRRDGIEPEEMYRWLSFWQRLSSPFRSLVSIPVWLSSRKPVVSGDIYRKRILDDPEKASYVLEMVFRRLRSALDRLKPRQAISNWSGYMATHTYSEAQFEAKERFAGAVLSEFPRKRVLDLGCNTGHFSALGARSGASVVAADSDPAVIDQVWRMAREADLNILPIVVDLARPTPATGWANCERSSFLKRAEGRFDLVIMLAVIHHLLVTERIVLSDILQLAARLTTDLVLIEFVGKEDSMFRRLAMGREHLHSDHTQDRFEAECKRYFEIVRKEAIPSSHRALYLLRKPGRS